jgi:hypothetical protein
VLSSIFCARAEINAADNQSCARTRIAGGTSPSLIAAAFAALLHGVECVALFGVCAWAGVPAVAAHESMNSALFEHTYSHSRAFVEMFIQHCSFFCTCFSCCVHACALSRAALEASLRCVALRCVALRCSSRGVL